MKRYNAWKYLLEMKSRQLVKLDLNKLLDRMKVVEKIRDVSKRSKKKTGFHLSADFKDHYDKFHKLELFNIYMSKSIWDHFRYGTVSVTAIKVDGKDLIDGHGGFILIPDLF